MSQSTGDPSLARGVNFDILKKIRREVCYIKPQKLPWPNYGDGPNLSDVFLTFLPGTGTEYFFLKKAPFRGGCNYLLFQIKFPPSP